MLEILLTVNILSLDACKTEIKKWNWDSPAIYVIEYNQHIFFEKKLDQYKTVYVVWKDMVSSYVWATKIMVDTYKD